MDINLSLVPHAKGIIWKLIRVILLLKFNSIKVVVIAKLKDL